MPGVKYVPMEEADRCCGMGGSFGVEHYDLSKEINDRKISNIAGSGADVVVTSCPGCLMHIRDGLSRNGHESIEAAHIMVLLERQLKKATALKATRETVGEEGKRGVERAATG
jgi:glycolate oxidase iron-sulfur subunit